MMISKRSWLLILILLGLVLNVPGLRANENASPKPIQSSSPSPSAGDKEKENKPDPHAQETQRAPGQSSEATKVIREPPPETQKEQAKTEPQNTVPGRPQEGWNWGSVPDWALVILAVITAWLGLRSLSDIATQAKASRDSADIAKLSMVAGDRAYVHYSGCRWISHADIHDGHIFWRIRVRWRNGGNTPTRELRIYAHFDLRDDALPQDYQFTSDKAVKLSLATIAPDGVAESGGWDISGTDLEAISQAKKHLYVWGWTIYRDVFPETKEHITKFCVFATNLTGEPMRPWHAETNPFDIAFAIYHRHNCADEDCGQDN